MSEEPTTSKSIALKTKANKSRKLKMIKQESSSSEEEDDHHESSSDVEDYGELALMMRKFTRLNDKINKKSFNFDPIRRMFRPWGDVKNKNCTIVEKNVTLLQIAPSRTKERKKVRTSIAMIRAMKKKMR